MCIWHTSIRPTAGNLHLNALRYIFPSDLDSLTVNYLDDETLSPLYPSQKSKFLCKDSRHMRYTCSGVQNDANKEKTWR